MGTAKKQKRARKRALKNRYCAGAKLSEYKFLRVLRGYAEGQTVQELAETTHVSSKTIRATYRALREELAQAIHDQPLMFGEAGRHLAHPDAAALLDAVLSCPAFRRYRKLHAPRIKDEKTEKLLVSDFVIRVFCALDLRGVTIAPDDLLAKLLGAIRALKVRTRLQTLADALPGAKPFGHLELRLYGDFRRHLFKRPLGTEQL